MQSVEFRAETLTVSGEGASIVSGLSLSVRSGDCLGITGPTGSGKTSLLHVLAGLVAPAEGRLLLGDRPVSLWRDAALGLVLQNLHLLPVLTAHETVALGMQSRGVARAEVAERVTAMLGALGLADHAGQLIQELSGGQRQRVAVARALALEPDLILVDEPTAALDPHWHAVVVDQLLAAARRGAVVVISSSDPELITHCDRVITLG